MNRFRTQQGAALVITLIMLGMVTSMTVVFLSISQRERASVTVVSDQVGAKLMAETATASALAKVVGQMVAAQDPLAYDLSVSTNYLNPSGFVSGSVSPANVSYVYPNGRRLTPDDLLINLANLQELARPPVFVDTNALGWRPNQYVPAKEFRFYLDLNRNRAYEPSGLQVVTNWQGRPVPAPDGQFATDHFIGDPEWIGQLESPAFPHSPNNRFIGRYAYMILPTGRSLDINHIHNQAREPMNPRLDNPSGGRNEYLYMRNQGVGSWELNMAGFLRQLNPIEWRYYYDWRFRPVNANGTDLPRSEYWAFSDARDILMHRYYGSRRNLSDMTAALGLPKSEAFRFYNLIDDYSDGPLILNDTPIWDNEDGVRVDPSIAPWPGAENPRRFTDVQQLLTFQPYAEQPQRANNFVSRLRQGMNARPKSMHVRKRLDSYERRTFYRLLSQMGVDSEPALRGKLNINHTNDWSTAHSSQTDWTANEFINRAAHAMLRASVKSEILENPVNKQSYKFYSVGGSEVNPDIGISGLKHPLFPIPENQIFFNTTNATSNGIQLYPTNAYSAEVHRLIQVAANTYDATFDRSKLMDRNGTVKHVTSPPYPPTVMRPVFRKYRNPNGPPGVFISHYAEVTDDWTRLRPRIFAELADVVQQSRYRFYDGTEGTELNINIYGVPWIIGVKKGFPNFNKFSVESKVKYTRRLEIDKGVIGNISTSSSRNWRTYQQYALGIENVINLEAINSYTNDYPRELMLYASYQHKFGLWDYNSTDTSGRALLAHLIEKPVVIRTNIPALGWKGTVNIPLFDQGGRKLPHIVQSLEGGTIYETRREQLYPPYEREDRWESNLGVPDFKLFITNRVQYFLVDRQLNRVVDVVNLDNLVSSIDITADIIPKEESLFGGGFQSSIFWDTNRVDAKLGDKSYTLGISKQIEISEGKLSVSPNIWANFNESGARNIERSISKFKAFMDGKPNPINELRNFPSQSDIRQRVPFSPTAFFRRNAVWQANDPLVHYTAHDLFNVSAWDNKQDLNQFFAVPPFDEERASPWGSPGSNYDSFFQDPLIWGSDSWKFPSRKFPSIGWLGRVHRGTPWQTIYLKSAWPQTKNFPTAVANLLKWREWSGEGYLHNLMPGPDADADGMLDIWEINHGLNPNEPLDATTDPDGDSMANLLEYRMGTHPFLPNPSVRVPNNEGKEIATRPLTLNTTHPTNDWKLLQLFSSAANENAARGLLSVNQTNAAAWSAVFSGLTVLSNSLEDGPALKGSVELLGTKEEPHLMMPTSRELDWILYGTHGYPTMSYNGQLVPVNGLYRERIAKGGFRTLGDILSTPTLTKFSPFINNGNMEWVKHPVVPNAFQPQSLDLLTPPTSQQQVAIHENVSEWIPQQILSLLKEDEPRVTVYGFGQALKPADNSIVTRPGQYYQMCTNYAVVGEVFTKTTYKIEEKWEGTKQVFRAVVEDYQVLAEE